MPEQQIEPAILEQLREETGRELIERLTTAYRADCGNTLRIELFRWHDGCYVNIRCEDDCPERRGGGKGTDFYAALEAAIEDAGKR